MLTPPSDLPEAALVAALERGWGMTVAGLAYRPVGWGSHHWAVTDAAGSRWFVTVDELENKRVTSGEPLATAFRRLRASLAAARDLRDCGAAFVLAPVPGGDGQPLARVSDRFGVAVYPFVNGQSFDGGEFPPGQRLAVLGLVTAVHTAPAVASRHALADDFTVPHRDELEAALDPGSEAPGHGPYARPVSRLVQQHAAPIQRLLARYDDLVLRARAQPARTVLTHGEPHPGNTMLCADGQWLLIDWDTALIAPPERDLWSLDPGDGTVLDAYTSATGLVPQQLLLDLYRLRWDIADIAIDVSRFRRPHTGSSEDAKSWELLSSLINRVSS
jgi:hypothetical protein